jgi:hypothetical protein
MIFRDNEFSASRKAVQFVQVAWSPLPVWKGDVLVDPLRQACLEKSHLHWVPHALSNNQKGERVSYSKLLLTALMEQKANGRQQIITGDESWFLLYYPHDSVLAASRDGFPQRIKQKNDAKKCFASSFGSLRESIFFLMCSKGQCTIHRLSLMLLCPV